MSAPEVVQTAAGLDLTAIGTALGSIGAVAAGLWMAWQRKKTTEAQTRADVAESNASTAVADAQKTVYDSLTDRVKTLEDDVRTLRRELSDERNHSRDLMLHIWRLETLMRQGGIEPPPFNPSRGPSAPVPSVPGA